MRTTFLLALLVFTTTSFAGIVPVTEDVTVNRANPDSNLNNITTRGGLLSGLDDTGSDYQFYLKFILPPQPVGSAKLIGTHTDKYGVVDSFHQTFFVQDDSWSETTMTFDNRPATSSPAGGGFDATGHLVGEAIEIDLTSIVQSEMAGDGVLSLAIATVDGRLGDLEFFASREFDSAKAFRLEITGPATIPLPAGVFSGSILLAAISFRRFL